MIDPDDLSLWEYCKDCGTCCEHCLVVSAEERQALVELTGLDPFKPREGVFLADFQGSHCPFRDEGGRCKVQEIKPLECLTWPLTQVLENGQRVLVVDVNCPAKDKLSPAFIKKAKELLAGRTLEEIRVWSKLNQEKGFKFD